MPLRLLAQIERHAAERPDAPAIAHANGIPHSTDLTWRAFNARIRVCAALFYATLLPGNVLMLCCPNRAEFSTAFLGGWRSRLRVFPVSPSLTAAELQTAAEQSSARALVGDEESQLASRHRLSQVWSIEEIAAAPAASPKPISAKSEGKSALLL